MKLPKTDSAEGLAALVEEIGILPFFRTEIEGFSIEELTPPELWFTGEEGPWEWKGPVIRMAHCAYGKFLRGRAAYISSSLFPDFANYRRDGYDYDSRMDEGIARAREIPLMQALWKRNSLLTREWKACVCFSKEDRRAFEPSLTHLQMQCYVLTEDFEYAIDGKGNPYGWGLARYTTPERFFGEDFRAKAYSVQPSVSYERLFGRLRSLFPNASEAKIEKLLG